MSGRRGVTRLLVLGLVVGVAAACGEGNVTEADQDRLDLPEGYEERYYDGMRYGLFVPPRYDGTRAHPLILRLHGSTDTTSWDLSWYHDPVQAEHAPFVLTPKTLVRSNGWGTSWGRGHSPDMQRTLDVMEQLKQEFRIDTTRLYVHGSSMGGFGVFSLLAKEPGRFAGAFSICGGGDPATAEAVMQTPLWIFHGSDDPVVPPSRSRNIYRAILEAGGRYVRYTEYPGVGHEAWEPAWQEPSLEAWLLAQRRGEVHRPPARVTGVRSGPIDRRRVTIRWDESVAATGPDEQVWFYRIFRDQLPVGEVDAGATFFEDAAVEAGRTYVYSVEAVNYFFGVSPRSEFLSVVVP